MAHKVVVRVGLLDTKEQKVLSQAGAETIQGRLSSEDELIEYAHDADAVIVGATEPYTRRVINALGRCKVISRMGIGCDNIDLEAATEQGIPVAYVPDASVAEVSDHAMAFLLLFSRKLIPLDRAVKAGAWQLGRPEIGKIRSLTFRLSEQTLGLVGVGRIGGSLSRKAKAFGMRVIFFDPYVSDELARTIGAERVNFDDLLRESDFISLHAPLTPETHHLFGLEQFKKMKPTAYIINTSRGGLIDEKALHAALSQNYIAGAGIDVTDPEPPDPQNPLLKLDNVMVTAHSAFSSETASRELRRRALEAVVAALGGKWPREVANPQVRQRANRRIK